MAADMRSLKGHPYSKYNSNFYFQCKKFFYGLCVWQIFLTMSTELYCLNSLISRVREQILLLQERQKLLQLGNTQLEDARPEDRAVLIRSVSDPCVFFILPDYTLNLASYFTNVRGRQMGKGVRLDLHRSIILHKRTNECFIVSKENSKLLLKNLTKRVRVSPLLRPRAINSVAQSWLGGTDKTEGYLLSSGEF